MSKKNKLEKLFKATFIGKLLKPKKKNIHKLIWILLFVILFDVILFTILNTKYSTLPKTHNSSTSINHEYNSETTKLNESIDIITPIEIIPETIESIEINEVNEKLKDIDTTTSIIDDKFEVAQIIKEMEINKEKIEVNQEKEINEEKIDIIVDKIVSNNTKNYVGYFYKYIKDKDYISLVNIFDVPFKNNATIKIYFSEKRLNDFTDSTDGLLEIKEIVEVTEDRKNTDTIIRKSYRYLLKYEIDDIAHEESWKMILVSRNGGKDFLVNSLFCESDGCSKSPFYK